MNDLDLFGEPNGRLPGDRQGRRAQKAQRKRQKRKRAGGRAAVLFAMAFLVAILGVGGVFGYAWLDDYLHPPDYVGAGTGDVTVQVKDGDLVSMIGITLQKDQVVKSQRAFVKVAKTDPRAASIQPGYYNMRLHMSSAAALALLLDPTARAGNQITIPEGLRTGEIVDLLVKKTGIAKADFEKVISNPAPLGLPAYAKGKVEGYLYPTRYDLSPNASATAILKMMVDRFKTENADLEINAKAAHMSAGDIVIMASLIQAEAGQAADEPKIARVLYNRIQQQNGAGHGHLQLDTTVLYALNRRTLRVTYKDLEVNSPYNTYRVKGLPVGAIDSPGTTAINAALHPASGNWYWFVATDPTAKITKFTAKYSEFVQFQKEFNAYLKRTGQ
jgi:UPF0755 protein